jgi:predicted O-methyltransferase YrrM
MSQTLSLYLRELKSLWLSREIPNISPENAEYLKWLIQENHPNHLLEIGTANGYSTLHFALAIPEGSDITTIEQAWNMHNDAVTHFKNCKMKHIHAIWWDAKKIIPILQDGYFDFVFIDAMKKEYLDYLLAVLPKCSSDAIIVIDDVEKFRNKMENLYEWLDRREVEYRIIKTDSDDSIMILSKPSFLWKI